MAIRNGDDGSRAKLPLPVPSYRVTISEDLEHSKLHLRLKELAKKERGIVIVVRRGQREDSEMDNLSL